MQILFSVGCIAWIRQPSNKNATALSYIFEFLKSSQIHMYITHIYQRSIKTRNNAAKQWNNKKPSHRNGHIFHYGKLATCKFVVNHENAM